MSSAGPSPSPRPEAHVAWAVFAITGAALAVCLCAAALGLSGGINRQLVALVAPAKPEAGFRPVPMTWEWAAAGIGAFAVASVLLHTPGTWRRVLFWLASLAVTIAWAPALALAAYAPDVSIPSLAILAAGAGSLHYTSKHRMPCDETN